MKFSASLAASYHTVQVPLNHSFHIEIVLAATVATAGTPGTPGTAGISVPRYIGC